MTSDDSFDEQSGPRGTEGPVRDEESAEPDPVAGEGSADTPQRTSFPRAMSALDLEPEDDQPASRRRTRRDARRRRDEPQGSAGQSAAASGTIFGAGAAGDSTPGVPGTSASGTAADGTRPAGASSSDGTASSTGTSTRDETPPAGTGHPAAAPNETTAADESEDLPLIEFTTPGRREVTALAWVSPEEIAASGAAPAAEFDTGLVSKRTRRRSAVLAPVAAALVLAIGYVAAALLWPLDSVAPTVTESDLQPTVAGPLPITWPEDGAAAVGAAGVSDIVSSSTEEVPMASITKLVTVLVALDRMPLEEGETGQEFAFTAEDETTYWIYRNSGESALEVPVDGTLTQYELIEGILLGSANNYAQRLVDELWDTPEAFAGEAAGWLQSKGISGITVVEPTGIDEENTATPSALIRLADAAMRNPIVSEIVGKEQTFLPGVGEVENSNPLIGDPGVVGVKTGTLLFNWNLLSARDLTYGDTTIRVYAAVMGQPDEEGRDIASRELLNAVETALTPGPSVTAGTVVAEASTRWGETTEVVVTEDASVVLWNGGVADVAANYDVAVGQRGGEQVGHLSVSGPFEDVAVDLELSDDLDGPDAMWRLTHPLELLGLG